MTKKTGKDLMEAARNADYKAIKACLEDGVPANYIEKGAFNEDPITLLLGTAGFHKGGTGTQTMECIKLLFENGADLNHVGGGDGSGYTPMDAPDITKPDNPLDLFNAVKFVLTHGGKNRRNRDYVMRDFESYGIMSKEQFEQFEKEGDEYVKQKLADAYNADIEANKKREEEILMRKVIQRAPTEKEEEEFDKAIRNNDVKKVKEMLDKGISSPSYFSLDGVASLKMAQLLWDYGAAFGRGEWSFRDGVNHLQGYIPRSLRVWKEITKDRADAIRFMLEHGARYWGALSCNFFTNEELEGFQKTGEEYVKVHEQEMVLRTGIFASAKSKTSFNALLNSGGRVRTRKKMGEKLEEKAALLKRLAELDKEIAEEKASLREESPDRETLANRLKESMRQRDAGGKKTTLRSFLIKEMAKSRTSTGKKQKT